MLINSFFLSISSSIDSLGIGITYGIKNTTIPHISKIIIFVISFITSIISIWFGNIIKVLFSETITTLIGNCILIAIGLFFCFQSLKKDNKSSNIPDFSLPNFNEEKIYSFFIKFLGITIQIIKNPINSDFNKSNLIDSKEALFLALALSLDSFCIGIGGSIAGISFTFFPFLISIFQLIFLDLGNFIGRQFHTSCKLPDNVWSILSGLLLISIGVFKIIF